MSQRLTEWFASQLPDARDVRVEGLDRVEVGHSAETLLMTLVADGERRDVVVRIRPEPPGLLEPYDLERQFTILRALDGTRGPLAARAVVRADRRRARPRLLRDGALAGSGDRARRAG